MLELYHSGLTANSLKVRLTLAEKGLDYVSHFIDIHAFEHHRAAYLALNPDGQIPTLVHDGRPLTETTVINEYLDDAFPAPPLRPADAMARAGMRRFSKLVDEMLFPSVSMLGWQRRVRLTVKDLAPDALREMLARVPLEEKRDKWAKAARPEGFAAEELELSRRNIAFFVVRMEEALCEDGPWIAGADYSLADINALPFLYRLDLLAPGIVNEAETPHVVDWLTRIQARPAVIDTYSVSEEAPPRVGEAADGSLIPPA